MNALIRAIVGSLFDIELAFKGELTMTEGMETLMTAIYFNKVPASWGNIGFTSVRALGSWLDNLRQRLEQLNIWKDDPVSINKTVCFLNRLYKPNSCLTAIK
jgi:dynein heavy chain